MPIKIDFYILQTNQRESHHFACQLLEKRYQEQQNIYVHMNSFDDAKRFDELLWTYREDSFIPHQLYEENDEFPPPIQIGFVGMSKAVHLQTFLLNLSDEIPVFFKDFTEIIEIVFSDPIMQQLARKRFKHYRDQGYEINTVTQDALGTVIK